MGEPIAKQVYDGVMAEVGELGALLADMRVYKEAIMIPEVK